MARRLLTWSGTFVVAAGTYLGVRMLGASAVGQAPSAAQMRDVAPATPTVGGRDNAPLSSPGGARRSMAPLTGETANIRIDPTGKLAFRARRA